MNTKTKNKALTEAPTRHVRLAMPDPLYKEVRHRLVEAGPEVSMSDVIVTLVRVGLSQTEGGLS